MPDLPRILVTGSRNWRDRQAIRDALDEALRRYGPFVLVHGACPPRWDGKPGADALADEWGMDHRYLGVRVERHPADWDRYGNGAGPVRNREMVEAGALLCLAFPLGESPGTKGCMSLADAAGIPVIEPARSLQ